LIIICSRGASLFVITAQSRLKRPDAVVDQLELLEQLGALGL